MQGYILEHSVMYVRAEREASAPLACGTRVATERVFPEEVNMLQNWALGSFGGQTVNPSILSSVPQAIQLLQTVPQQLQQLQQIEYIRLQQLQQIQQLVQYATYQLQVLAQHQSPQLTLGAFGPQALGQPFGSIGTGQSPFQPSPHVM